MLKEITSSKLYICLFDQTELTKLFALFLSAVSVVARMGQQWAAVLARVRVTTTSCVLVPATVSSRLTGKSTVVNTVTSSTTRYRAHMQCFKGNASAKKHLHENGVLGTENAYF